MNYEGPFKSKVKRFVPDESKSWEERYKALEAHHLEEVEEARAEITRLEGCVRDVIDKKTQEDNDAYVKELVTDEWIKAWSDEVAIRSDSEAHAIHCMGRALMMEREARKNHDRTAVDVVHLIGTLDRCISELLVVVEHRGDYHDADIQTIKHHAEDMILAGRAALKRLGFKAPD